MSHTTFAVVSMSGQAAGGASAASAVFTAMAATGGVLIAGGAMYLAARKMRADYSAAFTEYQGRSDRENAVYALQNASFVAAQQRAREMSLSLSQCALDDPNTAFFLSGLSRLKKQLGDAGGPNGSGPNAGEALRAQCDDLLARVAEGDATAQFAAYEKLSQAVAQLRAQNPARAAKTSREAMMSELVREQAAALRLDLDDSVLAHHRHDKTRSALQTRLSELETLVETQPAMAWQSTGVLRDRVRGEMRAAGESALREARAAARMRDLVGQISAQAQAILHQDVLSAPKRDAEALLKRVSVLVAATPVELAALETLATQVQTLFDDTERAIEEQAMEAYLEDQVTQVLGGLGYRVTSATNGQDEKMVAVLDAGHGVQFNIDGKGNLSGEMVAFSAAHSEVDYASQERVCSLMDDIFDGLRRRNLVVRETRRKNFKPGIDHVAVVQAASTTGEVVPTSVAKPLEMSLGQ